MNIHPLWYICLLTRFSLIFFVYKFKKIKNIQLLILLIIGLGFIYQGKYGSNNERQIVKVFWHNTRFIHGIIYLLATISLYKNNSKLTIILLLTDLLYSISYRIIKNI